LLRHRVEARTKVLEGSDTAKRVAEIEDELRLAAGLTALREEAGLSQRQLAQRIGISQPRVAAIEQSRNVTTDVLEQYVAALGGRLEVRVIKGARRVPLLVSSSKKLRSRTAKGVSKATRPARGRGRAATRRVN